jgi:hypothetical protein
MYLDIVLIDYLSPNGVLTTYRVTPTDTHSQVVIDRLRDVDINFESPDSINIGGARVYNASTCSIQVQQAKLRRFGASESENSISFSFEHMGIPVGSQREAHGGYYNFVLPPNFKFTELHIVDPYDDKQRDPTQKKHFRCELLWDASCNTSLATMFLTSSRGTFSFMLLGKAKLFEPANASEYLNARESTCAISGLLDYHIISPKARKALADDIANKSEWLELKPNIGGIGINLNAIIRDSIKAFQSRLKGRSSES